LVYRYTVFVPTEEIKNGATKRQVATPSDLMKLQQALIKDFGGVTYSVAVPSLVGAGARDPRRPKKSIEVNQHVYFSVYAAATRASDDYFRALQKELADALAEGIILVERQDVMIL
jgi:hypothetical protein